MPELGESVHSGTVSRWLKKVGEFVKEDEPVVEIMTDKVNTELPSPASGILVKINIPEGDEVEVFHAMGVIEPDEAAAKAAIAGGGDAAAPAPAPSAPVPAQSAPQPAQPAQPAAAAGGRRFFTPLVRIMAKEHGVSQEELAALSGSGEGGRVTKKDLQGYLTSRGAAPTPTAAVAVEAPVTRPADGAESTTVQLTGLRKMIADAMVRNASVPVVSTLIDIDVTNMVNFRSRNKDAFLEQNGVKLTYTPFFIKALAETLLQFPMLNSSLTDNMVTTHHKVHMGVAVSLGKDGSGGLIVPVVRDCDSKTIVEIARDLDSIAARARANQLGVPDIQGGTFTLTNPGSYGAVLGTPMINAPQAGIAGVYGIKEQVQVVNGMIAVRHMLNCVLTYDHRLVDGMTAGRFLQAVKQKLETFDFLR